MIYNGIRWQKIVVYMIYEFQITLFIEELETAKLKLKIFLYSFHTITNFSFYKLKETVRKLSN